MQTLACYAYDSGLRQIRTINFGTCDSDDLFRSATLTTWPDTGTPVPNWDSTGYDHTIVSATNYNERGLVDSTVDPKGRITKVYYDDISRRVAVVENDNSAALAWNTTPTIQRWKVTNLDPAHQDQNRVTSFVYDANSNVVLQVAHTPGSTSGTENVEVTKYAYGTTVSGTPGAMDSAVATNRLLHKVHYPDETTGEPGTNSGSTRYEVTYAYNRLGELVAVEDQNLTQHAYTRDSLGRVTADAATIPSGSPIDTGVQAITVSYDPFGRLDTVASLNGSATVNSVGFTYTKLWQVDTITEDNLPGVVSSKTVVYSYDQPTSSFTAATNRSRLSQIGYPSDGTVFKHNYGATAGTDDLISRIGSLSIADAIRADTPITQYTYVGMGMFAGVDYPWADVQLDRTFSGADGKRRLKGKTSQAVGVYPGWDRFGRVKYHAWVDGGMDATGTPAHPNRSMLFAEGFTYDSASNRMSKLVDPASAGMGWTDHHWDYHYDGVDRLIEARRGVWSGSTMTYQPGSQNWELDMLGNWRKFTQDLTSSGTTTAPVYDTSDRVDDRTHNQSNELGQRAVTNPPGGGSPVTLPLAYDEAGNMTSNQVSVSKTLSYVHDAWNRLVEVKQTASSSTISLGKYQYNGLHWRTVKLSDVRTVPAAPETLSERRIMYYDASWRLIQEDIDDHANDHTSSFTLDRRAQQFWGVRYIDDAVLRREDRGALAIEEDPGDPEAEPPVPPTEYVAAHGPDGTYPLVFHDITDAQFSVVALVGVQPAFSSLTAPLIERIDYDPYGNARHHAAVDFDGDGQYTITDLSAAFMNAWLAGSLAADYNRSGGVQVQDVYDYMNAWFASPGDVPSGWLSNPSTGPGSMTPDNPIGYCGYVFDKETSGYTVRFRHYVPYIGRWINRDPAGYADGMNAYEYAVSSPSRWADALGLDIGPDGDQYVGGSHLPEPWVPTTVRRSRIQNAKPMSCEALEERLWRIAIAYHRRSGGDSITQEELEAVRGVLLIAAGLAADKSNEAADRVHTLAQKAIEKATQGRSGGIKDIIRARAAMNHSAGRKMLCGAGTKLTASGLSAWGAYLDGQNTFEAIEKGDTNGAISSGSAMTTGLLVFYANVWKEMLIQRGIATSQQPAFVRIFASPRAGWWIFAIGLFASIVDLHRISGEESAKDPKRNGELQFLLEQAEDTWEEMQKSSCCGCK